jgi:hypothetical protein
MVIRKATSLVPVLLGCVASASAGQILETETARLLPAHGWKMGSAFEFQTSSEGREAAIPVAIEYGLTNRLELVVEPVPYTAIRPNAGRHASGRGDLEATLTTLVRHETRSFPALALAGEIKFATARDSLIGSGEPDYTGYFIASKRFGQVDTHLNLAYTIVGRQDTVHLNNTVSFAVAGVYHLSTRIQLFGEVLGNTGAVPGSGEQVPGAPEVAGGELVGTLGAGREMGGGVLLYLNTSYDNTNAVLLRPGLTWRFH